MASKKSLENGISWASTRIENTLIVKAERGNPLEVIAGVDPEISCLDLQPEFLGQKY